MSTVEVLQAFFKCGASAALVVGNDGTIIGEVYNEAGPVPGLTDALTKVLSVIGRAYNGFNKGSLERQQVHFGPYQLHIEALNGERNLVLVLGAKTNLGRIRLEIRKSKAMLESEIGA